MTSTRSNPFVVRIMTWPFITTRSRPFDQFDSHELRQERMFEVCGVVNSRRQQSDRRRRDSRRRDVLQRLKQMARIVADRTHVAVIEDLRKRALHDFAVLQNVGDAGRTSQVVFKNVILAVAMSERDPFR